MSRILPPNSVENQYLELDGRKKTSTSAKQNHRDHSHALLTSSQELFNCFLSVTNRSMCIMSNHLVSFPRFLDKMRHTNLKY
jgi:hypothetical protein